MVTAVATSRRFDEIVCNVEKYYSKKVTAHGATPRGADWNSATSQRLRFKQLLKICEAEKHFSMNDYGCGYGALAGYMTGKKLSFTYRGFDISEAMIKHARRRYEKRRNCAFFTEENLLSPADYTAASGIFNVKLDVSSRAWKAYALATLEKIAGLSRRGFAFNMLTAYADKNFMRRDLYYADPFYFFDACRKKFSRRVALLHDYPLFEFTLLVRTD